MALKSAAAAELSRVMTEDTLSIADACKEIPGRPSTATVWRWTKRGIYGVRLESFRSGHAIMTSRQAINRFLVELNAAKAIR